MFMYFFLFLLLSSSLGSSTNNATENNVNCGDENEPINFKMTKTVDVHITGNNKQKWDNNLNNIILAQISDTMAEKPNEDNSVQRNLDINIRNVAPDEEAVRAERDDQKEQNSIIKDQIVHITSTLENLQEVCGKSKNDLVQSPCNLGNSQINYNELCKRSVGISKPETCEIIDEQYFSTKKYIPKSCQEIQESGQNKSGIYKIQLKSGLQPFWALCDMETRGGGWIVIQKRYDGSEDFFREWRDYKFGFGNLKREFWLGLENIYHMTGFEVSELLVEITDRDKIKAYAHYKAFGIGPEIDGYILNVLRGFSGDAGDSLAYHAGCKFSTKDLDQDDLHCARDFLGGWWYKSCHNSNLNGKYINIPLPSQYKYQGLHWLAYRGHEYCHAGSRMLVRPAQL